MTTEDAARASTTAHTDADGLFLAEIGVATAIVGQTSDARPDGFGLLNYPNPFNPSTIIAFDLPDASPVELSIYNIIGSKVRTIRLGHLQAGNYSVSWDGLSDEGTGVSAGVYVCQLATPARSVTRKMLLVDHAVGLAPGSRPQEAARPLEGGVTTVSVSVRHPSIDPYYATRVGLPQPGPLEIEVRRAETDVPQEIKLIGDDLVRSRVGDESADKYLQFSPRHSRFWLPNQSCVDDPDRCAPYLVVSRYSIVYYFRVPGIPFIDHPVDFLLDESGSLIEERPISGLPSCGNLSDCVYRIDDEEARSIATAGGMLPGIKEWNTNFTWSARYGRYIWGVTNTLERSSSTAHGQSMIIDPITGELLSEGGWSATADRQQGDDLLFVKQPG